MRKFIMYLAVGLAGLLTVPSVGAQNIALGERTPRIKSSHIRWLNGHTPKAHTYTYIEFIHSKSEPCRLSTERIAAIADNIKELNIVVVTKEEGAALAPWVHTLAQGTSGVVVLGDEFFDRYGVRYAPFGVMLHKRRAIWFGNPRTLNRELIEKLTTTKQ